MPLVIGLLVWWLWFPLVMGVIWAIFNLGFDGMDWTRDFNLWLFTFLLHGATPWLYLAIGGVGTIAIAIYCWNDRLAALQWVVSVVGAVMFVVGAAFWGIVLWDNDKDYGRYYAYSTRVLVNDPGNVPDSLKQLADGASITDQCARLGKHDVFGCVEQGTLSPEGWDARVSSFTGAQIAMQRKVGEVQRSSLATETVTYLNQHGDQPAMWTGILDGSGKEQPMVGVVEWQGRGDATLCKFEGDYAIKRAFAGERGNNLPNKLAETFSKYRWDKNDVWGYCDGNQPVVVVPVTQPVLWMDRTVDTSAGIIVIRGDHGELKMEHFDSVKPGTYPGPVYPNSLVAKQREESKWIAGRKNYDRYGFGYDPTVSAVQQGNVSEYLLRDKATGRLVYVTPLTLRTSSSEVFVAYSVTFADEVQAGELNQLSLYVLEENDPRRINIDTLASNANTWMMNNAPAFRQNEGVLIEFTPVSGEVWRAFGEMNNQVVYQLDISLNARIAPKLVSVATEYASGGTPSENVPQVPAGTVPNPGDPVRPANADCGNELGSLTPPQLAQCAKVFVDELAMRQALPAPPK